MAAFPTLTAFGRYVPDSAVIDNMQISEWTGRSPAWIEDRTGISTRHYAAPQTPTSALAVAAVADLRGKHPGALLGVDAIILATSTPDRPQPATAAIVGAALDLSGIAAWDVNSVCNGFLVALRTGRALLADGMKKVLLIAADKYSTILDREDPTTVSLFGDGAAALVLESTAPPAAGIPSIELVTDGSLSHYVTVQAGGSELPRSANEKDYCFRMQGRKVREYVLTVLPNLLDRACDSAGITREHIGAFVCHQANPKLLRTVAVELGVDPGLFPLPGVHVGNLGAASLPLTLVDAYRAGLIQPGVPVALLAVGGGMSAGAAIYIP